MIKAIQTEYKGYKFRSRLEARWAVFFDAIGYKWEYEPEGYELSNGQWYLPDFVLNMVDGNGDNMTFFIEVKSTHSAKGVDKFDTFMVDLLEAGVQAEAILLDGTPDINKMYRGTMTEITGELYTMYNGYRGRPSWWNDIEEARRFAIGTHGDPKRDPANIARQARFEHGETPL